MMDRKGLPSRSVRIVTSSPPPSPKATPSPSVTPSSRHTSITPSACGSFIAAQQQLASPAAAEAAMGRSHRLSESATPVANPPLGSCKSDGVELPESAAAVVALLEQECRAGRYACLRDTVATYHHRAADAERLELAALQARLEADALRVACAQETRRAADLSRKLNELHFRVAAGGSRLGALDDDDEEDDKEGCDQGSSDKDRGGESNFGGSTGEDRGTTTASAGVRHALLLKELGISLPIGGNDDVAVSEVGGRSANMNSSAAAGNLEELVAKLRSQLAEMQSSAEANILTAVSKLAEARADAKASRGEIRKYLQLLGATKEDLECERSLRRGQVEKMSAEIAQLRQRLQAAELRHRTDITSLTAQFQKREAVLAKQNQALSAEAARLQHVEERMAELAADLTAARAEVADAAAAKEAAVTEQAVRYEGLRNGVQRALRSGAEAFDALPVRHKVGTKEKRDRQQQPAAVASGPSLAQLGEIDLARDLNGLLAAIAFIAKVIAESTTADVTQRVEQERARVVELSAKRQHINVLLARAPPNTLEEQLSPGEHSKLLTYIEEEKAAETAAQELARSTGADGQIAALIQQGGDDGGRDSSSLAFLATRISPRSASPTLESPPVQQSCASSFSCQGQVARQLSSSSSSSGGSGGGGRELPEEGTIIFHEKGALPMKVNVTRSDEREEHVAGRGAQSAVEPTALLPAPPGSAGAAPQASAAAVHPSDSGLELPLAKGVYTATVAALEDVVRNRSAAYSEHSAATHAARIERLQDAQDLLVAAHAAHDQRCPKAMRLPPIERVLVDPASPFGAPAAPVGRAEGVAAGCKTGARGSLRAGGRPPGKLQPALSRRRGLPAPSAATPPTRLIVQNATKR